MGMKIEKDSVDLGIVCDDGPACRYRDVLGASTSPTSTTEALRGHHAPADVRHQPDQAGRPREEPGQPAAPGGLGGGYRYWTITVGNLDEVVAGGGRRPQGGGAHQRATRCRHRHAGRPRRQLIGHNRDLGMTGSPARYSVLFAPRGSSQCGPGPSPDRGSSPPPAHLPTRRSGGCRPGRRPSKGKPRTSPGWA